MSQIVLHTPYVAPSLSRACRVSCDRWRLHVVHRRRWSLVGGRPIRPASGPSEVVLRLGRLADRPCTLVGGARSGTEFTVGMAVFSVGSPCQT